jgi:hypothetical protein
MVMPPLTEITPVLAPPLTPERHISLEKPDMLGAIAEGTGIPLLLIVVSACAVWIKHINKHTIVNQYNIFILYH